MRRPRRGPRIALAVPLAALLLGGCGAERETVDLSENSGEVTVEELGRVGARVYLEPERAEEIVAAAGLSPAEFEERVRSITNDPGRSLTYARAFEEEVAAEGSVGSGRAPGESVAAPTGTAEGEPEEPSGAAPADS